MHTEAKKDEVQGHLQCPFARFPSVGKVLQGSFVWWDHLWIPLHPYANTRADDRAASVQPNLHLEVTVKSILIWIFFLSVSEIIRRKQREFYILFISFWEGEMGGGAWMKIHACLWSSLWGVGKWVISRSVRATSAVNPWSCQDRVWIQAARESQRLKQEFYRPNAFYF